MESQVKEQRGIVPVPYRIYSLHTIPERMRRVAEFVAGE